MRILCFGDSITQGLWGVEGGWVERLRKHYDALSIADLDNMQPEVFNLGVSGDTTRSLLARIEAETKARTWKRDLPVVAVAIGANDGLFEGGRQWVNPDEFRGNLEKILRILKPLANKVVLVGSPACDEAQTCPVPWGDFAYTNRELQRFEQTMQEVAARHKLSFVPIYQGFKQRLDNGDALLADGLHPNDAGHRHIAEQVLPVLDTIVLAS